eukprot:g13462.t1
MRSAQDLGLPAMRNAARGIPFSSGSVPKPPVNLKTSDDSLSLPSHALLARFPRGPGMCTAMAPMQQRMQDLLEEVQGGFGFARLEELVKRPAETGSDAPESGRSSLGRALRNRGWRVRRGEAMRRAQEYERLVDLLCGPPVPYSASRGVRWRPPRRPRRLAAA